MEGWRDVCGMTAQPGGAVCVCGVCGCGGALACWTQVLWASLECVACARGLLCGAVPVHPANCCLLLWPLSSWQGVAWFCTSSAAFGTWTRWERCDDKHGVMAPAVIPGAVQGCV